MIYVIYFFLWTLMLYWIHRMAHHIPVIKEYHLDHHRHILTNHTSWHWNNLFLFNDTWDSTIDLWITEFYYLWASLIQETIEHNKNFDIPLLTSGKWHLIHHRSSYNYSLFFPIWDILFKTHKKVEL